jgi:predicted dehydrogenase
MARAESTVFQGSFDTTIHDFDMARYVLGEVEALRRGIA